MTPETAKRALKDLSPELLRALANRLEADVEHTQPDYPNLPAADKVWIVKAMGFTRVGLDHTPDCPRLVSTGYGCNCVPDAPTWAAPNDVDVFFGETWEERLAAKKKETQ